MGMNIQSVAQDNNGQTPETSQNIISTSIQVRNHQVGNNKQPTTTKMLALSSGNNNDAKN